ncbi:MAG TPA: hypothetical protein QF703_03405 [Candidatus Thalassarchaeaceae archaeon]|nr:hypothetical protein [Candidatus Thalassarchaeaceae archaeon]
MLDLDSGAIHLSYDAGAGATTFCLGIASSTLSSGNRVLWLTREVPDSVRAGQILGDLDKSALDRLVMIEVKGDLNITGVAIMAFLRKMQSADLLIVDDWCSRSGRAPKEDIRGMVGLITNARVGGCRIVFTSASYDDPTGLGKRKCRSEGSFSGISKTVFLSRKEGQSGKRVLEDNGVMSELLISESGFIPA